MNEGAAQAFVTAQLQIASALIELEAMKVANAERERNGHAFAYGEDAFFTLQQNLIGQVRETAGWIQ